MAEPAESSKSFVNPAFIVGLVGACLVIVACFLPFIERIGAPPLLLFTGAIDPGLAVIVLAVLSIILCLIQRFGWLLITAPLTAVAALMAAGEQLTALAGPDVGPIELFDVYNGILPAGMTTTRMVEVSAQLDAMALGLGVWLFVAGFVLTTLAPAVRYLTAGRDRTTPAVEGFTTAPRSRAIENAATTPDDTESDDGNDMLIDDLHIFADNMNQELSFDHRDATGRTTSHNAALIAAGYREQTYFLRCRLDETGETRDFAADQLSNVVDRQSGEAIATDELLDDLARVAHEAYEASNS